MAQYRIMLVDDEAEIREGIKRKIDWAQQGFELVGTAENGQEALELAESLHPDVVMTDIKMPFMDGLTLGRRLNESLPTVKILFFSGFDDFEYAQKAIQMGAAEYILKPIGAEELCGVLQKIRAQLDAEFAEKRNIAQLQAHYQSSLPLLREQFYTRLIDGRILAEQIVEQAARYEIDLVGDFWTVAFLQFDTEALERAPISQRELILLSLRQLAEETLSRRCSVNTLLYNDYVGLIASFTERAQALTFIDGLGQLCKLARRFLELPVTAGVGSLAERLTDLHHSASGARSALDYRVLVGSGRVIYIDDIEPDPTAQLQIDEQEERELLIAIKIGATDNIARIIERMLERFSAARLPLGQYQLYLTELMAELIKVIRTYQIDAVEVFGAEFDGSFHLSRFDSLDAFASFFIETCQKISSLIRRERTNSSRAIAENAKQFIGENFANFDISVEMLCDHLHVSPAYFSTLFKKETGMSFVAYLTDVRMEEAVRLLSTTEDKTYEISQKVGYAEPNYFSYVFKKQFGIPPSKYRNSKGADE